MKITNKVERAIREKMESFAYVYDGKDIEEISKVATLTVIEGLIEELKDSYSSQNDDFVIGYLESKKALLTQGDRE